MGTLRSVISAMETILTAQGYTRAKENFTLEQVPKSIIHQAYTFGDMAILPAYVSGNYVDYLGTTMELRIAWSTHGSHNATHTLQEALLDIADAYEALETAMVKDQLGGNAEEITFGACRISPLLGEENQYYLLLAIPIVFDVRREM